MSRKILSSFLLAACCVSGLTHAENVKLGHVTFLATTNVKMFSFKGEVHEMQAKIQRSGNQLTELEIRIPVNSIKTGMEIRDKHTVERIFTAADGSTPDIVYMADKSACTPGGAATVQSCVLDGKLTIRGQQKPYPLTISLKDGTQVSGHADINVLDFGVDPQLLEYTGIHVNKIAGVDFEVNLQ